MSAKPGFILIFINQKLIGSSEIKPFGRVEVLVRVVLNEGGVNVVPINVFWFHLRLRESEKFKKQEIRNKNLRGKRVKFLNENVMVMVEE